MRRIIRYSRLTAPTLDRAGAPAEAKGERDRRTELTRQIFVNVITAYAMPMTSANTARPCS
jgi:hypothetical protein